MTLSLYAARICSVSYIACLLLSCVLAYSDAAAAYALLALGFISLGISTALYSHYNTFRAQLRADNESTVYSSNDVGGNPG
jgi:hypothetical protein